MAKKKQDDKKSKKNAKKEDRKSTGKVLNNDYNNVEWYDQNMTFEVDPDFDQEEDIESDVDKKLIYDRIVSYLEGSRFNAFNEQFEDGTYYDLSKSDINEVYDYICSKMDGLRVEILYVLSDYFDVKHNKFYEALESHHKEELLNELKERGFIPKGSFGGALF